MNFLEELWAKKLKTQTVGNKLFDHWLSNLMTSCSEAEGSEYKYNEWIELALTGIFYKVKNILIKFIICINLSDSNGVRMEDIKIYIKIWEVENINKKFYQSC